MAADRPLAERGIVEIKMGKSKFPGKPSKIGNRRRVNLSSCSLPEDNDSSKAAKNIYLGLSVFNETFGDNEMVAPKPFYGFSLDEVEEAMAEARLQQKEAEIEHKKQGIDVNLWDTFQKELFSISTESRHKTVTNIKSFKRNKTILSFDGGGNDGLPFDFTNIYDNSVNQPSKVVNIEISEKSKIPKVGKKLITSSKTSKESSKVKKFRSPGFKFNKLQCGPSSCKSLQSKAAKRLLEKAKMTNLLESSKNLSSERKFILPSRSIHSSRVIKPNKRFLDENIGKKFLRSTLRSCKEMKEAVLKSSSDSYKSDFSKLNIESEENKKKYFKNDFNSEAILNETSESLESLTSNSLNVGSSKIILREARLQLDKSNSSLLEGPFSAPSSLGLNKNSQLRPNQSQSVPASKECGVCGVVILYKYVDMLKKFGIYCCESCLKFISKIINLNESKSDFKLLCVKGSGLCDMCTTTKNQHFKIVDNVNIAKCQACWLKSCIKKMKMPVKLKQNLLKLLPVNMKMDFNLDSVSVCENKTENFRFGAKNLKSFKWFNEKNNQEKKSIGRNNFSNKSENLRDSSELNLINKKFLRKRTLKIENVNELNIFSQRSKGKLPGDEKTRQSIMLKGPRVKHVCRSASVVLGQPLATFPGEASANRKQTNEPLEDCKNCTDAIITNIKVQATCNKVTSLPDSKSGNREKKLLNVKEVPNLKSDKLSQQVAITKPKKKTNTKIENPVSMDFWESYDPEEVCETGFGLIGSQEFSVRAFCFLCGSSGLEKLIHCASCCEPYHEFCVDEAQTKLQNEEWKYNWVCPRCTVCFTCGKTSGQQLKCIKCDNSYHIECVDRVGGRLLHSPDRPWVCSVCLRCKSCNGVDVSIFVGNLPLCKACFVLRQKGNYCPLCQRCYEDDDYDSKMMECGQCKCWVHAKCEGLSDEKYQVLSFLPESVEYVCRMCCVMPPAPWWIAVEAELKSGYLGVLKALSKNRKACTMLKWSPRKQCTCRQVDYLSRVLDFDDSNKNSKKAACSSKAVENLEREEKKLDSEKGVQPAAISERKTSIEVINHPTESLKLTLKIMKGLDGSAESTIESLETTKGCDVDGRNKVNTEVMKKCLNSENYESTLNCRNEIETTLLCHTRSIKPAESNLSITLLNPPNDSVIKISDNASKTSELIDDESLKLGDQQIKLQRTLETKTNCDTPVSFLEEKRECFCFLEVDSYNSRSKPFSPNLMSIKKKVTTSEYSSLHQFHQDMERMIATTNSIELMDLYYQTMREIFPWFDPKFSKVQNSSQKVSGSLSVESTPIKNTPKKNTRQEECKIPKDLLCGQSLDYFYSNYTVEDTRVCVMCKTVGDGLPGETGRLLYCGQNEWVHCNCALWSGEVFEEIDGSLQNVQSAISRSRSIRCPSCNLKGASIGCCAKNCQETFHFSCARKIGCVFMDDKTMYCSAHLKESNGKLVQNEKELEIRRPIYVELDKRKMRTADSNEIRVAVGALHVNSLGKFIVKLSDKEEAIVPDQFSCSRLFWSCYEPWRIVRYHFTVRLVESESSEGIDFGINITVDHSIEPEFLELKLRQLKHFQEHKAFLDINEKIIEEQFKDKRNVCKEKLLVPNEKALFCEEIPPKKSKKDKKVARKILDHNDVKEDEICLSDNQNTADLLPPDIEEAIFKDLPHEILDGISMQDIFMDIKNYASENSSKDCAIEELCEGEDTLYSCLNKNNKKNENKCNVINQSEFWTDLNEFKQENTNEASLISKQIKHLKRNKSEEPSNQPTKKTATLKTYQKSSNINRSFKNDNLSNKWKKQSKCHVTVNLLEPQERGNMLQELKFTDGLVSISTGALGSLKDLKARFEDNKRSIQEEGKENKFLSWQTRLQPRLLQVDGGVDSSSSGSEAGESPQRLSEENLTSKLSENCETTQPFPFLDSLYTPNNSNYPKLSDFKPSTSSLSYAAGYSTSNTRCDHKPNTFKHNLPQLDGVGDFSSDNSDSEDFFVKKIKSDVNQNYDCIKKSNHTTNSFVTKFKINQCDGGIDSECEGESFPQSDTFQHLPFIHTSEEEPVKCSKCRCTYRTKISYQRHLESCTSDFMLSSSEAEMSDEESPKRHFNSINAKQDFDKEVAQRTCENPSIATLGQTYNLLSAPVSSLPASSVCHTGPDKVEKLEIKKEKPVKKTYVRKKTAAPPKKTSLGSNAQVQQIVMQQPNATPALIVQDVTGSNIVPTAYIDSTPSLGYVTAMDSQNLFGKTHLIAAPNNIVSGNFQLPSSSETQILGGLCLNSRSIQPNLPSFIIQQPSTPSTLIPPQQGPILLSSEQFVLGSTGLFDIIHDPNTGGMFLTNRNQPVYYNMETIVSNTVLQTNQYVSNVLGTTTYSQTSTQIFQASEMEQVVNVSQSPSNYILVSPNHSTTDRLIQTDDLICLQTPPSFIQNQSPIQISNQSIFNPTLQAAQVFGAGPKALATPVNSLRCLQPICPPIILSKTPANVNTNVINQPNTPVLQKTAPPLSTQSTSIKITPTITNITSLPNQNSSVQIKPSVKPVEKVPEKQLITPKLKVHQIQPRSRALVDYINNFRSDACDTLSSSITSVQNNEIRSEIKKSLSPPQASNLNCIEEANAKKFQKFSPIGNVTLSPATNLNSPSKSYLDAEYSVEKIKKLKTQPTTSGKTKPVSPKLLEVKSPICNSEKISLPSDKFNFSNQEEPESPKVAAETKINKPELIMEIESDVGTPCNTSSSTVSTTVISPPVVREAKTNLSMPKLEDNDSLALKEIPKIERPLKIENEPNEILPLQENVHTYKAGPKSNSKSPQTSVQIFSSEKGKCKRKISLNDQNTLKSSLLSNTQPELGEDPFVQTKSGSEKFFNFQKYEEKGPKLIFDVISDDGFKNSATSMAELWANICDSVQEMRSTWKIPSVPLSKKGYEILGMQNHGLQHCLEQLNGVEKCIKYKCKYFLKDKPRREDESEVKENPSGCARTEKFSTRKEYDMFAWLASRHRKLPKLTESAEETLSSIRRANNLPMAMRYRNLKETAKLYVGVYRSKIHGRGLFCLREIEAGEMVIEYAGEVIRSNLTDKREKYYTEKGIGCYMFKIDDHFVVDATMKGNAARFINHSCEPNCYSRVVDILGKKHIVIFALRRINIMEELTYDYKFPFEDEKISCHCLSKKCRKYLN